MDDRTPPDGEPGQSAATASTDGVAALDAESLETAIQENPEAVARFVERLDLVNELLDVVELGADALEDDMVAELSGTAATLAEAGDAAATPGTVALAGAVGREGEDLAAALETLVDLQRSGTLDDLVRLADLVSLAGGALEDDMVRELARTGTRLGEVADVAAEPETARALTRLLRALGEAEDEPPERVGAVGLLRATRDPEVQAGLGYLLALARAVGTDEE